MSMHAKSRLPSMKHRNWLLWDTLPETNQPNPSEPRRWQNEGQTRIAYYLFRNFIHVIKVTEYPGSFWAAKLRAAVDIVQMYFHHHTAHYHGDQCRNPLRQVLNKKLSFKCPRIQNSHNSFPTCSVTRVGFGQKHPPLCNQACIFQGSKATPSCLVSTCSGGSLSSSASSILCNLDTYNLILFTWGLKKYIGDGKSLDLHCLMTTFHAYSFNHMHPDNKNQCNTENQFSKGVILLLTSNSSSNAFCVWGYLITNYRCVQHLKSFRT